MLVADTEVKLDDDELEVDRNIDEDEGEGLGLRRGVGSRHITRITIFL